MGIDDTLVFSWLFHPNSKDLDGFVSGIVSKSSSQENHHLISIVEALYHRIISLYQDQENQIRTKLGNWFSIPVIEQWKNYLTEEFVRHVKESRENKETISLAAGLAKVKTAGKFSKESENIMPEHTDFSVNLYGNVALKGICLYSET